MVHYTMADNRGHRSYLYIGTWQVLRLHVDHGDIGPVDESLM